MTNYIISQTPNEQYCVLYEKDIFCILLIHLLESYLVEFMGNTYGVDTGQLLAQHDHHRYS